MYSLFAVTLYILIPLSPLRTKNDLVRRLLLDLVIEDVDIPGRRVCVRSVQNGKASMVQHENLQRRGMLYRTGFSPILLTAAKSSSESLISWKLAAMREGVTDLGITLWPPTWAQASLLSPC